MTMTNPNMKGKPWKDFNQGSANQDWQKRHHRPKTDHEISASRRRAVEAAVAAHSATVSDQITPNKTHEAKMILGHNAALSHGQEKDWSRQKLREEIWDKRSGKPPTLRQSIRAALHGEKLASDGNWPDPNKQWQSRMANAVVEAGKLPPAVQAKLHAVSQDLHNGNVSAAERAAFDHHSRAGNPLHGAMAIAMHRHGDPRHWR